MTRAPEQQDQHSAAGDQTGDRPSRYRCLDYAAYYAGDDFKLFESPVTGARHVLPAISEQLLKTGDRFRTLDEHAAIICQTAPFREVPVEMVRELLAGLASADLLVSHQDLAERCTRIVGDHRPATIGAIGVPTCNRPGGLRRVVASAAENARRYGRQIEVVVADDSDEAHQSENLAVLDALGDQFGIDAWHAGPREKAEFAHLLAEHAGVPVATANVALSHAPGWPGAPGANRNTLLLHAIGEPFLTLDDDMDLKVARLPEGDDGLALTSTGDPTQSWFYATPDATLAATEFVDEDFLGLHESLLGCNVGRLAAEWAGGRPLDLDQLSSH